MNRTKILWLCLLPLFLLWAVQCHQSTVLPPLHYPLKVTQLSASLASKLAGEIEATSSISVADGLEVKLWAADTLVNDPIAISMDVQGRIYYTLATRLTHSEFDIRGHRDWMPASMSFESVEDRRQFLRTTFAEENEAGRQFLEDLNQDSTLDWRDLTVEKEQIWCVEDTDGDQLADKAQLYIEDFHEEITDLANGLEWHNGEVFLCVGPDLWRLRDKDGDGIADEKTSISHGFAVHIGFGAHGMSGAKIGPDGRIYWGIGDIGMNVLDKEGKRWKYPNQGVIVRSELDGSNFEVFASGLRNTHEFVFDNYGNLISEDNDGDHQGERERLVHLIDGSETGWRINWQFGKYTDPLNNDYKVWMDERMHVPRWEGQAAYFLPPIINYVDGPTGMVHNPGTALGKEWEDHFFIAEFRGTPAKSPIHAFSLQPKGASFELKQSREVVRGLLPTGLDFGPDGALYFADWIDGWGTKKQGRIWRLDVAGDEQAAIRAETKRHIQADFSTYELVQVRDALAFPDRRVRQKAQFELVNRKEAGQQTLQKVASNGDNQLARIHAIWGIAQLARLHDKELGRSLQPLLTDADPEIRAQAIRMLGDIRQQGVASDIVPALKDTSARVQLFAMQALGRLAHAPAVPSILALLEQNNDEDAWLRHAGMIALGRIGQEEPLAALDQHPSKALRTVAVVALRRMKSPAVARFLSDSDEYIAAEAARAINDDYSVEEALPALASSLAGTSFQGEAFLRRAINANLRVGQPENRQILLDYIQDQEAPQAMRAEALAALSTWGKTSVFDRVDGRYRGSMERDPAAVLASLQPLIGQFLQDPAVAVQLAAVQAVGRLQMKGQAEALFALLQSSSSVKLRRQSLKMLQQLEAPQLADALQLAIEDKEEAVRAEALALLPASEVGEAKAVQIYRAVIEQGSVRERQSALRALGQFHGQEAVQTLGGEMKSLLAGTMEAAVQLDLIEAVEAQKDEKLLVRLASYQDSKSEDDPLALYREALAGGDVAKGRKIFYEHEAAQCVRCHAIFEYGGNAGPGLAGVGKRLTAEQLLESVVLPSAQLAEGYGIVVLQLKAGETLSGIVVEETDELIKLRSGKGEVRTFAQADIASRQDMPSSMPSMSSILDKGQIRDVVAFLGSLR